MSPPELPQLTTAELWRLRQGHQVLRQERDGARGWGFSVVDVDAPVELVQARLAAFEEYPGMIPTVRDAEVHSRSFDERGGLMARCTYRVSKFWLGIAAVHVVDDDANMVRFSLDERARSPILSEASGFWHVEPVASGLSRVWLRVELNASSLLPGWLVNYASQRALKRASVWLKPHMERLWREEQGFAVECEAPTRELHVSFSRSRALRLNPA